jgi:tRNA A-37 threonylcarbamoyl transferase component Bud32
MQGDLVAGRYRIEEEIGRGGMGVVFRALDTLLSRRVALKMLPPEAINEASLRGRLASEARTASHLSHPGIAIVFDFVEAADATFIVYELVAGRTLRRELATGPFNLEELSDAGFQLADALAAAHEQGVIHRDLKPENIMVVPGEGCRGRMKILDFGLAKHLAPPSVESENPDGFTTISAHTTTGFVAGTISYMAPEQLEAGQTDARTDIFALGLILYETATGCHPFRGGSVSSTIANILTQAPASISQHSAGAPEEINRIIQKCLRKHATERYQSAKEVGTDFGNFRAGLLGIHQATHFAEARRSLSVLTEHRSAARLVSSEAAQDERPGILRKLLGPVGSRPYLLWEFLHINACIRCALLIYLGWRFRNATTGRGSLILLFLVTVSCVLQIIIAAVLLLAGEIDRKNLHKHAQAAAPWLRVLGLTNGLFAFVMAALVAEFHTFLALFLTVLGVAIAFTAIVLKPAMDRTAIGSGE